jgi:hypothetical protein
MMPPAQEKADSLLYLDLRTPTVTQKIAPQDKLDAACLKKMTCRRE